jgi:hypothetical protein
MAKDKTTAKEVCDGGLYEVVDNPFYDGVQLHPVGAVIPWAGPPSASLVKSGERKSTTASPIFADPLSGRGDKAAVAAGKPLDPVVLVQ